MGIFDQLTEALKEKFRPSKKEKRQHTYAKTWNGKKIVPLQIHLQDGAALACGLYAYQILLLSKAESLGSGKKPESFWWKECGLLDEEIPAELEKLKELGFLTAIDGYHLLMLDTAKELREVLEVYGLPQNGRKEELAERICEHVSEEELKDLYYEHPYMLTEKGKQAVETYAMIPYVHDNHFGRITIWEITRIVPTGCEREYKSYLWEHLCRLSEQYYHSRKYENYCMLRYDMARFTELEQMNDKTFHFVLEGLLYEIFGLDNHGLTHLENVLSLPIIHIRQLRRCTKTYTEEELHTVLVQEIHEIDFPVRKYYTEYELVQMVEAIVNNDRSRMRQIKMDMSTRYLGKRRT